MADEKIRQEILDKTDHSCFISAGAGAGKTSLVVDRIIKQISEGVKPEQLVVITFTKKAAGELYDRIAAGLEKKLSSGDEKVRYAFEHLGLMQISTIHSFCATLLRENAVRAKIPVDFDVVEDADERARAESYFYEWYHALNYNDLQVLYEAFDRTGANVGNLCSSFLKLYDQPEDVKINTESYSSWTTEEQGLFSKMDQLETRLLNAIKAYDTDLQANYQKAGLPGSVYDYMLKDAKDAFNVLRANGDISKLTSLDKKQQDAVIKISLLDKIVKSSGKGITKDVTAKAKLFNDSAKRWKEAAFKGLDISELEKVKYYMLITPVNEARKYYLEHRDRRKVTNNELLTYADALVRDAGPEFMHRLRGRYTTIYVDEFQDTDHVQADLVWRLATDDNGDLRDGAFVAVGDPKQSIYRFRGAEPEVFFEIRKRMEDQKNNEKKVLVKDLSDNHRSNETMIQWFNTNFSQQFGKKNGRIVYSDMIPEKDTLCKDEAIPADNKVISGAYYYPETFQAIATNKKARRQEEADVIASLIQKLTAKDSKYRIYAKDGKSRDLRPICYSDFLILTRKADIDEYRYGLKSAGIPVTWAGKVDISSERILRKVQILLNGLVEIRDKVKRTGAIDLLNNVVTSDDTKRFDDLYKKTKKLGIMGKLRYIADHLNILTGEPESNDDIQQVYQMVESVYGAACDDPTTVLSYIEDYIGRELDYELPLDEKEMKDSVRLMNVHKAKGLEGHIVIIANRGNDMSRNKNGAFMSKDSSGSYVWNGTVPIGYGDYSEEIGLQKIDGTPENDASKVEEDAENLRLEYVAGTRAEEALIVMNEMVQTGRAFFGKKNDADGGYTDYKDFDEKYPDIAKGSVTMPAQASVNSTTINTMRDDVDAAEISLTPSSLENRSSGRVESKEDRPSGNVFGTVMHRAFELSVNALTENKSTALEDVIPTAVRRAVMESYDKLSREGSPRGWTPERTDKYLVDRLTAVFGSGLLNEVRSAQEVYTEFPFAFYLDPSPVWVNGFSDLIIKTKEGKWYIIDYKSDSKPVSEPASDFNARLRSERYAGQLRLYQEALAKVLSHDEPGIRPDDIETKIVDLYESH